MLDVSEAVRMGHPDKICDIIADTILVRVLKMDPLANVSVEACVSKNLVVLMGNITTSTNKVTKDTVDSLTQDVLYFAGYNCYESGLDYKCCYIMNNININKVTSEDQCEVVEADDYCTAIGYATAETESFLPLSTFLANDIAKMYDTEGFPAFKVYPDGKVQVSIAYDSTGHVDHIDTIDVSLHAASAAYTSTGRYAPIHKSIKHWGLGDLLTDDTKLIVRINDKGGPAHHQGLSGRKIGLDTYCGHAKFMGGALSGKSSNKLDRSATYIARYIAKHVVASGIAKECEVTITYVKGDVRPSSLKVDTKKTSMVPDDLLAKYLMSLFVLTPSSIVEKLDLLKNPGSFINYYNHFYDQDNPWEKIDSTLVEKLKVIKSEYLGSYCES